MIVNTAYIYMGAGGGGGTPVNPNLWQDGVANYPVEFTNSSISSDGLNLKKSTGVATFSELQLTGFNSLTISPPPNPVFVDIPIVIEFFNSAGQKLGTETVTFKFGEGAQPQTVNIPSSAKIQNAKIRIKNNSRNASITLSSALLS